MGEVHAVQWDPVHAELSGGARVGEAHGFPGFSAFQMFRHTDSLFPILLQTLSDESDEVGHPLPSVMAA